MSAIELADNQLQMVLDHAERIERLYLQRWLAAVADQLIGRELSDESVRAAIDVANRLIGAGMA